MKSGIIRRCAVYTRKSSEQGLEQDFNSLDAQREAAVAYIASQKHDGWTLIDTQYDDGGWSGGNMERPGLKALLADIESAKIDIVVVYKVDRLTRSLADFAKLVEAFDKRGVSFVSVTQQFNTTTSMGRLTLNVLLSFAQFEREVTGERIRDKVLASKKKGIFMGGNPPLGYDIANRRLNVNETEAERVREIFRLYLELRSVRRLKEVLDRQGSLSKAWVTKLGRSAGGFRSSKGALYYLLKNRVYRGETLHKGKSYPGEHQAIVPSDLFDAVQLIIESNKIARKSGITAKSPSLLRGLIDDSYGRPMTPSHSKKRGQRYRYYVSSISLGSEAEKLGPIIRLPAIQVESIALDRVKTFLGDAESVMQHLAIEPTDVGTRAWIEDMAKGLCLRLGTGGGDTADITRQLIKKVRVSPTGMEIDIITKDLRHALGLNLPHASGDTPEDSGVETTGPIRLRVETRLQRHGAGKRIFTPAGVVDDAKAEPNEVLIAAVAQAFKWRTELEGGNGDTIQDIANRAGISRSLVSMRLNLAYLAPDIVEAILDGRQSRELQLEGLAANLPLDWKEQQRCLM